MQDSEIVWSMVSRVTGISKTKMLSRSRLWPIVEARMLFVLTLSSLGHDDQCSACLLKRNRTTILKARHNAEDYIGISKAFKEKYNKIKTLYDTAKSV